VMKDNITVSVIMITYAHEKYIQQAINGVLMQNVNFHVELIIADDCSKDNTESIVSSYSNHPNYNWIKYTKHRINKGMMLNLIWSLKQAKGKYIALCEGDDYWTDPLKLQKQVDFLQTNSNVVLYAHQASILHEDSSKNFELYAPYSNDFIIENIKHKINNWNIPTLSVMFKRENIKLPNWFEKVKSGDFFLYNIIAQKGSFYFSKEIMGVYRNHSCGISKKYNRIEWIKSNIENMKLFSKEFNCFWAVRQFYYSNFIELHYLYLKNRDKKNSYLSLFRAILFFEISMPNIRHILKYFKELIKS
jgi:glycosyltransferase involved in cell wall biosynthesis